MAVPNVRDIDFLATRYCEAAEGTADADSRNANVWAEELRLCFKELQSMPEGRVAISNMMSSSNIHVKCWAAAHSLMWSPDAARRVLEGIQMSDGPCSFDAKWTLREYDRGSLKFD